MGEQEASAASTPFLDFLLLTLCVLIAVLSDRIAVKAVEIRTPEVGGDSVQAVRGTDPVVVELTAAGRLLLEGEPADVAAVEARLEALGQPAVLLRVDTALPSGRVLDLLSRIQPHAEEVKVEVAPASRGQARPGKAPW